MSAQPRIAVVTPELHTWRGSERCTYEQVARLRDRYSFVVYTMGAVEPPLTGVDIRKVPWLAGPLAVRYVWWFLAQHIVRAVDGYRGLRPDIVFSPGVNCLDADVISVHLLAQRQRDRIRAEAPLEARSWRGVLSQAHRRAFIWLLAILEKRVYKRASLVVASERDRGELATRYGAQGTVVPHGVDLDVFTVPEATTRDRAKAALGVGQDRVVLLIANDIVGKGVDTALRAVSAFPDNALLVVLGLVNKVRLRQLADSLSPGSSSRIRFEKPVRNIVPWYHAADVLIAPSREDSFGLPILEGAATGLPIIVSAHAGASELFEDGRDALVLSDPESAAELAQLVARVLADSGEAQSLGAAARETASAWTWQRNADALAATFEQAMR